MAFKRSVFLFLLVVSSTFLGVEIARGQVYSLQTNVLGWGTTNMNLEFGLKFSHRWTFHFPLQYNPFSLRCEASQFVCFSRSALLDP